MNDQRDLEGLSAPAQLDHLVEQVGPVDVLVNNAGFSWFGPTTLLARPAQPGESAGVIAFLASPKAGYIAGAVFAPTAAAPPSNPVAPAGMAQDLGRATLA